MLIIRHLPEGVHVRGSHIQGLKPLRRAESLRIPLRRNPVQELSAGKQRAPAGPLPFPFRESALVLDTFHLLLLVGPRGLGDGTHALALFRV
jgi:hypothetical protein